MIKAKKDRVLAYHFITPNKKLGYQDNRVVKTGEEVKMKPNVYSMQWRNLKKDQPAICIQGMHASKSLEYAYYCATEKQTRLCWVEVWGQIDKSEELLCGQYRKILASVECKDLVARYNDGKIPTQKQLLDLMRRRLDSALRKRRIK